MSINYIMIKKRVAGYLYIHVTINPRAFKAASIKWMPIAVDWNIGNNYLLQIRYFHLFCMTVYSVFLNFSKLIHINWTASQYIDCTWSIIHIRPSVNRLWSNGPAMFFKCGSVKAFRLILQVTCLYDIRYDIMIWRHNLQHLDSSQGM